MQMSACTDRMLGICSERFQSSVHSPQDKMGSARSITRSKDTSERLATVNSCYLSTTWEITARESYSTVNQPDLSPPHSTAIEGDFEVPVYEGNRSNSDSQMSDDTSFEHFSVVLRNDTSIGYRGNCRQRGR